jgi:hypothetical protein
MTSDDEVTPITEESRSTPMSCARSSNPLLVPAPITVETVLLAHQLVSSKGIAYLDSVDWLMAECEGSL